MTDEGTLDATSRLKRMERDNRLIKLLCALILIALATQGVMGQASQSAVAKVIEAERLVIRDVTGKKRVVLDAQTIGAGWVVLDQAEMARASLVVLPTGDVALSLLNSSQKEQVTLAHTRPVQPYTSVTKLGSSGLT